MPSQQNKDKFLNKLGREKKKKKRAIFVKKKNKNEMNGPLWPRKKKIV